MRFVFRVDASREIGTGHLSRCSVLAREAKSLNVSSVFITNKLESQQLARLKSDGNEVLEIAPDPESVIVKNVDPDSHMTTQTRGELADAERVLGYINSAPPDLMILDSYQLGQGWIDRVRSRISSRILVIDDLRRPLTDVDLLIDQNLSAELQQNISSSHNSKLGPRYAILDYRYRMYREKFFGSRPIRERIVISVGGSDVTNLTHKYVRIVKATLGSDAPIDVVIGPNQSISDELFSEIEGMKASRIWQSPECLADLFSRATLALGAGGTSSWERACLGVPSLISSVAPNQRQNCEALSLVGAAVDLGDSLALDIDAGCTTLARLLENPTQLAAMEHRSKLLVDGFGSQRILRHLVQSDDDLNLREVRESDIDLLFLWRNDLEVRTNSLRAQEVSWEDHERWFYGVVRNKISPAYILETGVLPVGQLRFEIANDVGTLTYSVDRDFRGRGYGKFMITRAKSMSGRLGLKQLLAKVKATNEVSRRVFEQCGFTRSVEEGEFITYQLRIRH